MNKFNKLIIDSIIPACSDIEYKIYGILLEAAIQWRMVQVMAVSELINHPKVMSWGRGLDTGRNTSWENMHNIQKANVIFGYLERVGALEKARDVMNEYDKLSENTYEVNDVNTEIRQDTNEHIRQLKKSKIMDEIKTVFLNSF